MLERSRIAVPAFTHLLEQPETVMPAYALLYRIRDIARTATG